MRQIGIIIILALLCSCHSKTKHQEYTASDMERADSILNHVRTDILSEELEVQELASGVLELKERLDNIKEYTEEADGLLEELENQGYDVADVRTLMENILNECDRNNN